MAKSGGHFTSPVDALNSITDASVTNRYLVKVMPGIYDLGISPLIMKEYVGLEGSGQENTEVRSGTESLSHCDNATVVMASHATVKNMKITNYYAGVKYAVAVLFNNVGAKAENIKIEVNSEGTTLANVGICTTGTSADVALNNIDVAVHNKYFTSNNDALGIITISSGSVTVNNSRTVADGGQWASAILSNNGGVISVRNSVAEARNGDYTEALSSSYLGALDVAHTKVLAENGKLYSTGIYGRSNDIVKNSEVRAKTTTGGQVQGIVHGGKIANTLVEGSIAATKIFNCYNENFDPIPNI